LRAPPVRSPVLPVECPHGKSSREVRWLLARVPDRRGSSCSARRP
jgi:hypothetical protein